MYPTDISPNFICSLFFRIGAIEKAITNIGHPPVAKEKEHDEEKRFLKKVMQYLLETYINKMRHTECEGCIRSYPSLRDHSCLMEETEYHIDRHFDSALSSISQDFVAGVFAFHGRILSPMDWVAYKASHNGDLQDGLADLVNPVFDDVEFGSLHDFYNTMKLFI